MFFPGRKAKGRRPLKNAAPLGLELTSELYADRLLAAHWNRSEPAMAVALLAAHYGVELLLQHLRDRTHPAALADLDLVDRTDRRHLGGRAREEHFVGDIKQLPRNRLLHDRNILVAGNLQNRIARDARQHRVPQRR